MTKLTETEYLNKVCKENKFTLKIRQVKVEGASKTNIRNCIANMEELIKWRAKFGITQKDMATLGILGMNMRKYQRLEGGDNYFIGHTIIKKIRMKDLVHLEFIEEENKDA